jgi:ectoine hydroxylase-related dioxygenase (phytanoyl-CoA dioxygenase family)
VIDAVLAAAPAREAGRNGWQAQIFDRAQPATDRELHRILRTPSVIAAVEALFEGPARVYYGMLAVVPANGGQGLPWHQDNMYSTILGRALNVFVALSAITPDMATLWVSPKSHLRGVQPSHPKADGPNAGHREADVDPADAFQLPDLQPGDACIFDRSTLHRSLANSTPHDRYAYAAQYCEGKAREAKTGETYTYPLARDLP